MTGLCGTAKEHCCMFNGVECPFVAPAARERFEWQCNLKVKYGTWEEVHNSPEYLTFIKDQFVKIGRPDMDCGDYPIKGEKCHTCGRVGE